MQISAFSREEHPVTADVTRHVSSDLSKPIICVDIDDGPRFCFTLHVNSLQEAANIGEAIASKARSLIALHQQEERIVAKDKFGNNLQIGDEVLVRATVVGVGAESTTLNTLIEHPTAGRPTGLSLHGSQIEIVKPAQAAEQSEAPESVSAAGEDDDDDAAPKQEPATAEPATAGV